MLWMYSRRQSKVLLLATLMVFTGYAFLLSAGWYSYLHTSRTMSAQTVGVFASVQETEMNRMARDLAVREGALTEREQALARAEAGSPDGRMLTYMTVGGGALLCLILLNFYLDLKRRYIIVR